MRLTHSLPAKIAAIFLLLLVLAGTAFSAMIVAADVYLGMYTGDYAAHRQELREDALRGVASDVLRDFRYGRDLEALYGRASFFCTVTRAETDETLFSNLAGGDFDFSVSVTEAYPDAPLLRTEPAETEPAQTEVTTFVAVDDAAQDFEVIVIAPSDADGEIAPEPPADSFTYTVTLYAKKVVPHDADDRFALLSNLLNFAYRMRYGAIALCAAGVLAFFTLLIFLYCSAGRRRGEVTPRENLLDRIPFDLFTVLVGGAAAVILYILGQCLFALRYEEIFWLVLAAGGCLMLFLLFLLYTMSIATRIKVGRLFKNTVIRRVFAFLWRMLRKLFALLAGIPMVWKTALALLVCFFIEFVVLLGTRGDGASLFLNWMLSRAALFVLILYIAVCLRRLQKAGEKIAAGSLTEPVDTRGMTGDFKKFGETLGSIGDGLSRAVDERMKSERMKTELITNVSHDIKTPLTSIINYVDLLKKEEPENETVRQYLDILDRQSTRLKKLIEDLVEASKASTGNISVELAPCEVGILLEQTVGEYAERLEASNLTPILSLPEEPVRIYADARRMWRVFDNLMNNICKYAQSGTRAYLELAVIGSRAVITFKNISKDRLTTAGEELTERFVRGDSSRNTEGSGLGLSIAQSLIELQGGRLMITTDGDLFKATVSFDVYTEETPQK